MKKAGWHNGQKMLLVLTTSRTLLVRNVVNYNNSSFQKFSEKLKINNPKKNVWKYLPYFKQNRSWISDSKWLIEKEKVSEGEEWLSNLGSTSFLRHSLQFFWFIILIDLCRKMEYDAVTIFLSASKDLSFVFGNF